MPLCTLHPLEAVDEFKSTFTGTFNVFWHSDKLFKTYVFTANYISFLAALEATASNQRRRLHRNIYVKLLKVPFFWTDVWEIVQNHKVDSILRNIEITGCNNIHLSERHVLVFVDKSHASWWLESSVFSESGTLVHFMWLKFPRWCIKETFFIFVFRYRMGSSLSAVVGISAYHCKGRGCRTGVNAKQLPDRATDLKSMKSPLGGLLGTNSQS